MGKVKPQTRHPVGEGRCRAACNEIGQGTKRTKPQPEEAGNDAPEDRRTVISEGEADERQYCPDIQIIEEPHAKAVEEALQKNKNIDHPEYFSAEKDGIEDNEQADDLNIRQDGYDDLSHEEKGSQDPH